MEKMASRYSFVEPSEDWPGQFAKEAKQLRQLLGDDLLEVHHVGSTSVPGLAAKPIIDVIPLVRAIDRMDELSSQWEQAGYRVWGEYGIPGRRFFTKDCDGVRTHNLHVFERGAHEVERHLAFAAYLRAHPEACREYEEVKRRAYGDHPADIEAYNDAKDPWIKKWERVAVEWWRRSENAYCCILRINTKDGRSSS